MKHSHDKSRRAARVAEPVQVYLDEADRSRLNRLADSLNATMSDVLRRALLALEREMQDPAAHPLLRVIGIASATPVTAPTYSVSEEHDRFLADSEQASWSTASKHKPPKRAR